MLTFQFANKNIFRCASLGAIMAAIAGCGGGTSNGNSNGTVPNYTVQYLGDGVGVFRGIGLNDNGVVVGTVQVGGGTHAARLTNGGFVDIGTLGGPNSTATGVNDAGVIVGVSDLTSGGFHAFSFDGTTKKDLGNVGATFFDSRANGINFTGQICGWSNSATSKHRGMTITNGAIQDIGDLGGGVSDALSINDNGFVVGTSLTSANVLHAFVYSGIMTDIGAFTPTFINAAGQVTGSLNSNNHAALHSGGVLADLGTLGGATSIGLGITTAGIAVGASDMPSGPTHAFIYIGGPLIDLNTKLPASFSASYTLTSATKINPNGQILATATNTVTGDRPVLLTPVP